MLHIITRNNVFLKGISGWYPVNLPPVGWNKDTSQIDDEGHGTKGLERVVGGLEVAVKFAHHNDRERVIHTARGVGWSPIDLDVEEEEVWESDGNRNLMIYQY